MSCDFLFYSGKMIIFAAYFERNAIKRLIIYESPPRRNKRAKLTQSVCAICADVSAV